MKTSITKMVAGILLIGLSAIASTPKSTITDTKVYEKSFDVNVDANVMVNMREADISITTGTQSKVEVKVTLTVEAYDQEDINDFFEEVSTEISGSPENVSVSMDCHFKNTIVLGNTTRVKTKNHGTLKLKSYKYQVEIKMPETNHLNLKNRFGDVQLGGHKGNIDLELYECDFNAGNIDAQNALTTLKFSNGNLGNFKNLKLEAYECELTVGKTDRLNVNAKFTKLNLGFSNNVLLECYESSIQFRDVTNLKGKQSFGNIAINRSKKIELTLYEVDLNLQSTDELTLPSVKFSKVNARRVQSLQVASAYETDFTIERLQAMNTSDKFGNYKVGELSESVELTGYETDCTVDKVDKDFKQIRVGGKFSNMDFTVSSESNFDLEADLKFARVQYPSELTVNQEVKESSNYSLRAKHGQGAKSRIKIVGYEGSNKVRFY